MIRPGAFPAKASPRLAGVPIEIRHERQLSAAGFLPVADLASAAWAAVVDGGWLIDRRLLTALAEAGPYAAIVADDGNACAAFTAPVELIDRLTREGPVDFAAAIAALESASGGEVRAISPSSLDPYVQTSRRAVPIRLLPLRSEAERAAAEATLIPDAQKGVLDWPARFLHPPVENMLVRLLWPSAVTPNQISIATFVMGLAAAVMFALGRPGWALVTALLVGALDGVDGKLARTKLMVSAAGEWEHVGDKIVEYLWYLCLAVGLVLDGRPTYAILAGLVATVAMGADIAVAGRAQHVLDVQLDDLSPFDRAVRLIGARRNTHMWLLAPFAVFSAWLEGLVAIAASAVITLAVHAFRLGAARRALSA